MFYVVEEFRSIQGEGLNTGVLTDFVRFSGCNLRCKGWPCDTPRAQKKNRQNTYLMTLGSLTDKLLASPVKHVCLTGGEPLVQDEEELDELINQLCRKGKIIDLFTNMTFDPEPNPLPSLGHKRAFVCYDFKLPCSGESGKSKLGWIYNSRQGNTTVKFVYSNAADLEWAEPYVKEVQQNAIATIFTPVGGQVGAKLITTRFPQYLYDEKARVMLQMHKCMGVM